MKPFSEDYINNYFSYTKDREPDFNNLLKVLNGEEPHRFTLFEFLINDEFDRRLPGEDSIPEHTVDKLIMRAKGFQRAGYDYCTLHASDFNFPTRASNHGKSTMSVNDAAVIFDRKTYDEYQWLNPEDFDTSRVETVGKALPHGMKLIVFGPGGVLENVMTLVGYEGLCMMMADDEELLQQIFNDVGSRLLKYYEIALEYDAVGACISNDDWGFNTQTMLSPADMRKFVFPWHKKIADAVHKAGKPIFLHSCGKLDAVYDDIINDMKFNGKHSYEDNIQPVEEAYDKLKGRIAVMGGLDMDYVCRKTPKEIYERACNMLQKTKAIGGYALGTGNSIPNYVPWENYLSMISAATVNVNE